MSEGNIIIVNPDDKFTNDLMYFNSSNKELAEYLHRLIVKCPYPMGSNEWALLNEVWNRLKSQG